MKTFLVTCLSVCILLNAQSQFQLPSQDELIQYRQSNSDLIAFGSYEIDEVVLVDGKIYTLINVTVEQLVQGNIESNKFTIYTSGGVLGTKVQLSYPSAPLKSSGWGMFFCREFSDEFSLIDPIFGFVEFEPNQMVFKDGNGLSYSTEEFFSFFSLTFEPYFLFTSEALQQMLPVTAPVIDYFEPLIVSAGTGDVLDIYGSGFGSEQGSGVVVFSGNIYGQNSFTVEPFPSDYLEWSDTHVRVRVPSRSNTGSEESAATGHFRVISSSSDDALSPEPLVVSSAVLNVGEFNERVFLSSQNAIGGYTLNLEDNFYLNSGIWSETLQKFNEELCANGYNLSLNSTLYSGVPQIGDGLSFMGFQDLVNLQSYSVQIEVEQCGDHWYINEFDVSFNQNVSWHVGEGPVPSGSLDFSTYFLRACLSAFGFLPTTNDNSVLGALIPSSAYQSIGVNETEVLNNLIQESTGLLGCANGPYATSPTCNIGLDEDIWLRDILQPIDDFNAGLQEVHVRVENLGLNDVDAFEVHWTVNDIEQQPYLWSGILLHGEYVIIDSIGSYNFPSTPQNLVVWIVAENENEFTGNNEIQKTIDLSTATLPVNLKAVSLIDPDYPICENEIPISVRYNKIAGGANTCYGGICHVEINGLEQDPVYWSGSVGNGQNEIIALDTYVFNPGENNIRIWSESPNGMPDSDPSDDTLYHILNNLSLGGSYTLGGQDPDFATFLELRERIDDYGFCSDVVINIRSGIYPQVSWTELVVPEGISIYFQSESGIPEDVVIESSTSSNAWFSQTITNVTFKNITFQSLTSSLFRLTGYCENLGFEFCRFIGLGLSQKAIFLDFQDDDSFKNISILDCIFEGCASAMEVSSVEVYSEGIYIERTTSTGDFVIMGTISNVLMSNCIVQGEVSIHVDTGSVEVRNCILTGDFSTLDVTGIAKVVHNTIIGNSYSASCDLNGPEIYMRNNIVCNLGTGFVMDADGLVDTDYNAYYSVSGALYSNPNGSLIKDQTYFGINTHSVFLNPLFSNWEVPVLETFGENNAILHGGIGLTEYPTDILGVERPISNPSMGAHQVEPLQYDIHTAAIAGLCVGDVVSGVKIVNSGIGPVSGFTVLWSVNGNGQQSETWTGNLMSGDTAVIQIGPMSLQPGDEIEVEIVDVLESEENALNNVWNEVVMERLSGTYTIGAGMDFNTFGEAVEALNLLGMCDDVVWIVSDGIYSEGEVEFQQYPNFEQGHELTIKSASEDPNTVSFEGTAIVIVAANNFHFTGLTIPEIQFFGFGKYLEFRNCKFYNWWGTGFMMHSRIVESEFTGPDADLYYGALNVLYDFELLDSYGVHGRFSDGKKIKVENCQFDILHLDDVIDLKINQNRLGACHIDDCTSDEFQKNLITNNVIVGESILLQLIGTYENLSIAHNTFVDLGESPGSGLIVFIGDFNEHCTFENNIVKAAECALYFGELGHFEFGRFDYNVYDTQSNVPLVRWNILDYENGYVNLYNTQQWSMYSGFDANSIIHDVVFSDENYHILDYSLENWSPFVPEVLEDMDGELRSAWCDPGADEMTTTGSIVDLSILRLEVLNFCDGQGEAVAILRNIGEDWSGEITLNWAMDGIDMGVVNAVVDISSNDTVSVSLGFVDVERLLPHLISSSLIVVGDEFTQNNDMTNTVNSKLSGEVIIGENELYSSISELNYQLSSSGLCGPLTVIIESGLYLEDELSFLDLNGSSEENNLTYRSQAADSTSVLIRNVSSDNSFVISNAKNLSFEDLGFQMGSGNLTLVLFGNTQNIRISNCYFEGDSLLTYSFNLSAFGGSMDNMLVENCYFLDGGVGMSCSGPDLSIINNVFEDTDDYSAGHGSLRVLGSNYNTLIRCNHFYSQLILENQTNFEFSNNYLEVGDLFLQSCDGSYSNPSKIYNNFFPGWENSLQLEDCNYVDIIHNNIRSSGTFLIDNPDNAACLWIRNSSHIVSMNNNYRAGGSGYGLVMIDSEFCSGDYNNFYGGGFKIYRRVNGIVSNFNTLTQYFTQTGNEGNSISFDPMYPDIFDLHVYNPNLENSGLYIEGYDYDIDGDLRSNVSPTIGADESTFPDFDAAIWDVSVPVLCSQAENYLQCTVKNFGQITLTYFEVDLFINGQYVGTWNYDATLPILDVSDVLEIGPFDVAPGGEYIIMLEVKNPNGQLDENYSNNLSANLGPVPVGLLGSYTVGPDGDFITLEELDEAIQYHGICGSVAFGFEDGDYFGNINLYDISISLEDTVSFYALSGENGTVNIYHDASVIDNYMVKFNANQTANFSDLVFYATNAEYSSILAYGNVYSFDSDVRIESCTFNGPTDVLGDGNNRSVAGRFSVVRDCLFEGNGIGLEAEASNIGLVVKDCSFINQVRRSCLLVEVDSCYNNLVVCDVSTAADYQGMVAFMELDGVFSNNRIIECPAPGLRIFGASGSKVYNNMVSVRWSEAEGSDNYAVRLEMYSDGMESMFAQNTIYAFNNGLGSPVTALYFAENGWDVYNNLILADEPSYAISLADNVLFQGSSNNFDHGENLGIIHDDVAFDSIELFLEQNDVPGLVFEMDAQVISSEDLHLFNQFGAGELGVLTEFNLDFDGEERGNFPDLGADEYSTFEIDVTGQMTVQVDNCSTGDVYVQVHNTGISPISYLYLLTYSGDFLVSEIAWNGLIPSGEMEMILLLDDVEMAPFEEYVYTISLLNPNNGSDDFPLNNTLNLQFSYTPLIAVGYDATVCENSAAIFSSSGFTEYEWSNGSIDSSIEVVDSGVYTLIARDEYGCVSEAEFNLLYFEPPALPTITQSGESLVASYEDVQWYFMGEIIPGATEQVLQVEEDGEYMVSYTDPNGCIVFSDEFTYVDISEETKEAFSVYPNPMRDQIVVTTNEEVTAFELQDIAGRKIPIQTISQLKGQIVLNMEELSEGTYFLVIQFGSNKYVEQIVKVD